MDHQVTETMHDVSKFQANEKRVRKKAACSYLNAHSVAQRAHCPPSLLNVRPVTSKTIEKTRDLLERLGTPLDYEQLGLFVRETGLVTLLRVEICPTVKCIHAMNS